jgi:bifunctional non-homologous end joining protein LigD
MTNHMSDRLETYRAKRDRRRTPEPVPDAGPQPRGEDDTFVIQEHHATSLHWDLRLERGGVMVSWAIPRGLPLDPKRNHLAVHTEDHPLEYATFAGEIPAGEYGGGTMTIWDRGRYEVEKWRDDEVMVVLHGQRAEGRYVLFRTGGKNWMIHRMDPRPEGWSPLPELIRPMLATLGPLPPAKEDDGYAYEMKWDGVRLVLYVSGGRVRAMTRNDREVSATYPELRGLGASLGVRECVLDGEVVALDADGRPSFGALQPRMHVTGATAVRRLVEQIPVTYLIFDVLHLDGRSTVDLPYVERRELLESMALAGPRWQTPPYFVGGGALAVATSQAQGLEGVLAKRLDSAYTPGRRSPEWIKVKNIDTQEVVIGGWRPGSGRRAGMVGSLLVGVPGESGLTYLGHVGTGFTDAVLADLTARVRRLERRSCPFDPPPPRAHAKDAHWVTPKLVGEVAFGGWTRDNLLRHASWRGLRVDKSPDEVRLE